MRISVSPKRIGLWLLAGALTIYAASFLFAYLRYFHGHDHVLGFARLFRLRPESTVPTWYSSFLLLACAFVLSLIHLAKRRARDPFRHHWLLLAILFLFLSVDETAQIHETIGDLAAKKASGLLGGFAPAWTAVYGPLVALFAVFYFRFLRHLPRRTAILFVLSGFLYVGGALGVESLSGYVATRVLDPDSFAYALFNATEEMSEMFCAVLFNYALLSYLSESVDGLAVSFAGTSRSRPCDSSRR